MRLSAFALLLLSPFAWSQPPAQAVPPPPPGVPAPDMSQAFASLSSEPGTHSGVTFDRAMLSIAQGLLESDGMDQKRAAAALTAVAVDNYRFSRPTFYTPEAMESLLASYKATGWKHLVNANQTPANSAQPDHTLTDLWLHFSGADIDAVTVLARGPRSMNVIQIRGDLRPLDLLHLSGHLGIPRVDPGAVMVPDKN